RAHHPPPLLRRTRTARSCPPPRPHPQKSNHGSIPTAVSPETVYRQDVRVRQRRHRLGLPLEPSQRLRVRRQLRREDFDRHVSIELRVPRPVHLAHPSRSKRRENLVGTKAAAGGQRHFAATNLWNRGLWRSGSKFGPISTHPGER